MYQRREQKPGPLVNIEQARRRNAELRIELVQLNQARQDLEAKVAAELALLEEESAAATRELSAAHKKLTRQIRRRDTVRTQAALMSAGCKNPSDLPEPMHGGREGLLAAADEMARYGARKRNKPTPIRSKRAPRTTSEAAHGTWTQYRKHECRCDECKAWKAADSARATARRKRAA